jgi:CubicO group peptidase (beta-lactamase class C family)
MLNRRRVFCSGAAATLVAGAARSWAAKGPDTSDEDAILDILKRRIDVEKRSVGMAACTVNRGRHRFVTWGRERVTSQQPVTPDTVFEIGSVTKVFTALLLANMARRGEVQLDDPVARHLPADFNVPEWKGRPITLADLATHTSGLQRMPPLPGEPLSPAWREAAARFSLADFRAWLAGSHPPPPPEAGGWWYSNAGYALLGLALAHRGGRPFEALLKERVIDAVGGLRSTSFRPTAEMKRHLAGGHDSALVPLAPFEGGIFAAAGALRSSARDLGRFATAILPGSGARIETDAQLLLTVRRPAPWIGGEQALGWEVRNAPGGSFVGKDGVTYGQAASMVFDPDKRVAIVVLSNTHPDLRPSTLSGGGVGAADVAQHLLRPQIPMDGRDGAQY